MSRPVCEVSSSRLAWRPSPNSRGKRAGAGLVGVFLLLLAFLAGTQARAALLDTWSAAGLELFLDDGDAVGAWLSAGNRTASAAAGLEPTLKKDATPSGHPALHFDHDWLRTPDSPVAGLSAFTLAVVFKADAPGVDEGSGWSTKSGIVDANQAAITNDWGFAIRETGFVCFGASSPGGGDKTVYLDNQPTYPSVADGRFHVVVCAWGGGTLTMYLDDYPAKSMTGAPTTPRDNAGLSFGATHSGEASRRFVGDLAEVQFYNTALSEAEARALIAQLADQYLTNRRPAIVSFTASTNFLFAGQSATLAWSVSNATAITLDPGIGVVSGPAGVRSVAPAVTTTYTLTASNAHGISLARTTITVDAGIPVAHPQSLSLVKNTSTNVTLTGADPQGAPLSFALVQLPQHGSLSGTPPNLIYTPQPDYVGPDFFTFKVNDGTYDSPPGLVELVVKEAPLPPHGIFISTTALDSTAAPGAFLAALRAVDVNREDTHSFSLVPGFGATNNASFLISGNSLRAAAGFPFANPTNLYIRVRATDSDGLFSERAFVLNLRPPNRSVVINEIHYNPDLNTLREEFIELYNPGDAPVNLASWRLRGGVDFIFPSGATLPAGGYLVVASDPATLQSRYAIAALGPWSGNLSSEGERITLRNPGDEVVDEVDYRSEFPWPILPNGNGPSMELIHPGLDNDLGSSWATPLNPAKPSPGARNRTYLTNAAPNIRQVKHSPREPASTNAVRVTAKVTDPHGVASVVLHYQVVAPGKFIPSYLPLTLAQLDANPFAVPAVNPAFEAATNWLALVMRDDGLDGDETAGDDLYTAMVPVQPNRTLVRYRITCADTFGAARRAPFEDDPSLNFAFFVYDGVPAYGGIAASNLVTVPIYFLITRNEDFEICTAYDPANQIPQTKGSLANEARFVFNWPGAIVYDGEVYDHIRYRLRGANGRYQPGKRNFRIKFNDGRALAARDEFGNAYPRKWRFLNTAKGQSNRQTLTFALNEYVNYFLLNKVGVPSPHSFYFHWRVVRGPQEAPDLYNGDFYGLSWAQENYDAEFLETHNLPKGNLYKLINAVRDSNPYRDMVAQQRYQGPFAVTNGGDAVRIQNALLNPTDPQQTDDWLLANVNYTNWYAYHTVCEAVRNYDTWPSANKNAAWYFDTNYTAANQFMGRFWTLPWDMTDTWGPTWNAGQDLAWNGIWGASASVHTNLQRDYRNTMREIRDLLFQPGQINPVIDAIAARIKAIAPADLLRWSYSTPSGSAYASLANRGPGFQGLLAYVQDMKNFMFVGGSCSWWLDRSSVGTGGWITRLDALAADPAIPTRPTIYYVGPPGYPMNSLVFECLPFLDPQGAGTFAGMQWRLAEVADPSQPPADPRVIPPLEWDAVWDSGILSNWNNRMTIPGVYVQTNRLYRARVRHLDNTGRWSRWSEPVEFRVTAVDVVALLREGLRFTEVMYNPPPMGIYGSDDLEFVELANLGASPLDLSGLTFTAGITFTFTNGARLAAGERLVLGRNAAALAARYPGLVLHGLYSGKLDNAGETLRLSTPSGITVLELTYDNAPPWPVTADGLGWSLVLDDPVAGTYRPSAAAGGSPGASDPPAGIPPIRINELLTHTDPPQLDTIELFNPTAVPVSLAGWFLSDDPAVPRKYRIPSGVMVPPGGYVTFDESQFNVGAGAFALSSLGDDAYLFSGDAATNLTGYVHGARFGAARNGVSFGWHRNSVGEEDFVALSALTLGTNNARPVIGPAVISEIMFQPAPVAGGENYEGEFIELQNVTATNLPLHDTRFPTNTWRLSNAVSYQFPPDVFLPPGGRLLVVPFDPQANPAALANFRSLYPVASNVPIVGPWSGRLNNDGETLELEFPDNPQLDGSVPYVRVEKVAYKPVAPWPAAAAGTGLSLQRLTLLAYANDPANWFAASPTPGGLSPQTSQDVDGDGVPDLWEMSHGTDPFVADAGEDRDGDGYTNYQEWLAGTDPLDAQSHLRFESIVPAGETVVVRFTAAAGRTYSLLGAPTPDPVLWLKLADIPAAATNRRVEIEQPISGTTFFRLTVPAPPQ